MPTLLTLKNIRKISLVDQGAAIGAKVAFAKKDTPMPLDKAILDAISTAVAKALKPTPEPDADPFEKAISVLTEPQQRAVLFAVAKGATVSGAGGKVTIVRKEGLAGMDPGQLLETALSDLPDDKRAAIMAAVGALHAATPPVAAPTPTPAPGSVPAKADHNEDDDNPKPDAKAEGDEEEEGMPKVLKGLTAEADEYIKGLDAKVEKLQTENAAAIAKLAERDAAEALAEQVTVAKGFPLVSGDVTKRGAILLGVLKTQGQDAYDELVRTFKSANARAQQVEKGTARAAHVLDGDSPKGQLEELTKTRMADKSEDYSTAFVAVSKAHPDLYREAKREEQ